MSTCCYSSRHKSHILAVKNRNDENIISPMFELQALFTKHDTDHSDSDQHVLIST